MSYSDEEMWHNKQKQRLAPRHPASSHIEKEKKMEEEGGGVFAMQILGIM